jgi:hypothetical protein
MDIKKPGTRMWTGFIWLRTGSERERGHLVNIVMKLPAP